MDDLDHSMHISDYDWLSFFEESEECCLLLPSLAYPDSSGLSDADDLEFPTETCADCTKGYTPKEDSEEPKVLEKEVSIVRCVEDQLSQQPAESDLKSKQEPKLPVTTTGSFGGDCASCPGTRAEKERWFVTVNDNPHRHQVPGSGPLVKKRRKQKKILKEDDTHKARGDTRSDLDITSQIKTDPGSIQEKYLEITSTDLTNTCLGASSKEDHLQCLAIENTSDPTSDIGKPNDDLLAPNTNSVESDEFADDEFFSSCSNDSENYLSAAESVEEPQHISLPNSPLNLPESINAADNLADRAMHISDNPLTCSGTTISCHQSNGSQTHVETSQIFPSAHHSTDTTPNDNSTCDNGTKSTELCMSVDKPTSAVNLSSAIGDQPESLPTPDVTVDSPEAYVRATGNTQSVYAISAFWDEMEKFTINDILQIRMGRCMLPVEEASDELQGCTSDTASPAMANPVNPESGILDVSDTTDSDYCTHLDESKPDRSSCDFSSSDFEEEYWQFINSSRSSSPDQYDKSYRCTDYASTGGEESDEMGTPVPSEDCSGQQWSRDSTFSLCDLASPQQIRKNKSMYDISALNSMEDLSSRSFLDRSSSESLVEPLKMSDGFEVVTPVMCHTDEHYQISFPKVFEYLFADNKAKYEAMSVSVYGLQEMPTSPVHDYTLCTADSDLPMSCSEEPIPIFSCSYPTVRELTFPKPGCFFLGTNYTSMKDVSPIQIVSQSLLRSIDCKHTDRSYCFSQDLSSLFSIKRVCFQDRGSVDASDVWRYQIEDEKKAVNTTDSCITVVSEEGVLPVTPKMSRDAALRQIAMEGNQIPTDYQSIFSTIKQSDMCLVCIAFASWVLKSSDPEAADAWKAALLANVSALSAIQYLRQYMKKKATPQDDL